MNPENLQIPRILIVDISANFGGANARVLALMKRFPVDRIGLATIQGSLIAPELEKLGYRVHRLAINKFDPRILPRLVHVIRDFCYQVVDTQNPQSKLWGSLAAFWVGAALVSTLNSWYMNEHPKYSLRWFIYSGVEFSTNFALSRYIVVSREIQNAMIRARIPANRIDLIYNAVELKPTTINGDRNWLLRKYNLPDDAIICLAAGRLTWAKAHDDLVEAVCKAREENPHLYCVIAGEGELQAKLMEQISKLGMREFILLPGYVEHDDLLSALKACDIYVMPSRTEGTPVALLEAAAFGKPIVASNVGGIPELVTNGKHALLVEVGDIVALSRALLRVAGDSALSSRLGRQAKARVEEDFSLLAQVEATAMSYIKACKKTW
jgi:glycosyltransferase involved in cell wall biosynthesis